MPETALFAPVRAQTLKENILEMLTGAILSGKIRPGERLNESELARQLQVSRAPIREALQQLSEQGLVMNHPRRGMFVVSLEKEDLQKINSLRIVLEAEALRLTRSRLTPQIEKKLTQIVERMEGLNGAPALQLTRLDLEFHRTIWSQTGNEYLEKSLTSVTAPLFAYAVLIKTESEKMRMIQNSHRPLLEFVRGRRKGSAEDVMLDHLKLGWDRPEVFWSRTESR